MANTGHSAINGSRPDLIYEAVDLESLVLEWLQTADRFVSTAAVGQLLTYVFDRFGDGNLMPQAATVC